MMEPYLVYSIQFWLIYFHMAQWSRTPSVLINLINAIYRFFCWSSNVLIGNSSLFITTGHANSKYSYYFLTSEFLKYSYQKWIEGVFVCANISCIPIKDLVNASFYLTCISEMLAKWHFLPDYLSSRRRLGA